MGITQHRTWGSSMLFLCPGFMETKIKTLKKEDAKIKYSVI